MRSASPRWEIVRGEAFKLLQQLRADSVDAVVTDPPAGIGFMGKDWDDYRRTHNPADVGRKNTFGRLSRVAPEVGRARDGFLAMLTPIMSETLRVLKPGGHALVWALPRTSHWTASSIEEAGFEVRDVVMHLFGTGFPKSLNVGDGRGTALKPAAEHWILARKRLDGTVAANVLRYGTGALNIDGCRIEVKDTVAPFGTSVKSVGGMNNTTERREPFEQHALGRWPANITLDEHAAELLDAQTGILKSGSAPGGLKRNNDKFRNTYAAFRGQSVEEDPTYGDAGGASRFFYVAKPTRAERDIGGVKNTHPTVKSIALMRWLCRLITPPNGLVLDPFSGSGSTGLAALEEGFSFLGFEREEEYVEIARRRIGSRGFSVSSVFQDVAGSSVSVSASPPVTLLDHPISKYIAPYAASRPSCDFIYLPKQFRDLALGVVTNCPSCGVAIHPFVPTLADPTAEQWLAYALACPGCVETEAVKVHVEQVRTSFACRRVDR